jgi:hypothetical protein
VKPRTYKLRDASAHLAYLCASLPLVTADAADRNAFEINEITRERTSHLGVI